MQHCRLSIPRTKIANEILRDGEKRELDTARKTKIGCFVDPDMEVSRQVSLRRWGMDMENIFGQGWKKLLTKQRRNLIDLAENDVVELWSFRSPSGELCFVLVTLKARQAAADKEHQGLMMTREEEESHLQIVSIGYCPHIDLTLKL